MFQPKICIRKWYKAEQKFGGAPNIYQSRIKNSSLYLLPVPYDSHFTNCTVFFGTPCILVVISPPKNKGYNNINGIPCIIN